MMIVIYNGYYLVIAIMMKTTTNADVDDHDGGIVNDDND